MSAPANDRLRVLISGAAHGIGLACSMAFADCGAELILCDVDGAGLAGLPPSLAAFSCRCDVVSETSLAVFAAEVGAAFPSVDILINAAGRGYVRSLGMVRMSRALLPLLRKAGRGALIINLVPAGGFVIDDGMFPYAGSKESFDRLSEALADHVRGMDIHVACVAPQLARGIRADCKAPGAQVYRLERIDEPETAARIVSLVAAKRPGWPIPIDRRDRSAGG